MALAWRLIAQRSTGREYTLRHRDHHCCLRKSDTPLSADLPNTVVGKHWALWSHGRRASVHGTGQHRH